MSTDNCKSASIIEYCTDSKECNTLKQFKEAVADLRLNDKTLLRFLRAREYNLEKAENMIRKSTQWRNENEINGYIDWQPPKQLKNQFNIMYDINGKDHEGRAVVYVPIGGFLAKECIENGHKEDILKWTYHMLESALKALEESGHTQVVALLGMENLSMRQIMHIETMQTLYQGFQVLEQNYPEVLKHFFIVNAPWLFSIAYNFVKPILSDYTISKLQIYNTDKNKWLPALLKVVPIQSVPKKYLDDSTLNIINAD